MRADPKRLNPKALRFYANFAQIRPTVVIHMSNMLNQPVNPSRLRSLPMTRILTAIAVLCLAGVLFAQDTPAKKTTPIEKQVFDKLLESYENLTYEELERGIGDPGYLAKIGFDPTTAKFYDEMAERLQLNDAEKAIFKKNGFVSVDHDQRYSFGSAYYGIYTRDLPVLVTTDSILHALHRSYDDVLMFMEQQMFTPMIDRVLAKAHSQLANNGPSEHNKDVDLYITVARNLLKGAGSNVGKPANKWADGWDGKTLHVKTAFEQDGDALTILEKVKSLKLEFPLRAGPTAIYGGTRFVDWSQFKPRGHYTKTAALTRYFRTMMWLGRADTGFNVLPPDPAAGNEVDSDRELRAAVAVTMLLKQTGGDKSLASMDHILGFMVGKSDNLSIFGMQKLVDDLKLDTVANALKPDRFKKIKEAIESGDYASQMIRSQLVMSDPNSSQKTDPPSLFQVFGQRYIIDSFVLSQVVYDSIMFNGKKQRRMMPHGLDVMAALGNDEAIRLLKPELNEWKYSANLRASRDYVNMHKGEFWNDNLYNVWLGSLRMLDDRPTEGAFPQVMQTKAWQMKQLQTQLASWAELRHDTILYAKQSYTAGVSCEYPTGYVEPYPEFYAAIKKFGEVASARFKTADFTVGLTDKNQIQTTKHYQNHITKFFDQFAITVGKLEELAKKELASEPFTTEDIAFLKKTVDRRGGGSGPPTYDGWFGKLFFNNANTGKWDPTVVDIHTDPNSSKVREVGVGDVNYLVVAIDNEGDRMVYVGPVFSYYEFDQPTSNRLDDPTWHKMIREGKLPDRPEWTDVFQGPKQKRTLPRR